VYEQLEWLQKGKECVKKIDFGRFGVSEPLDELPGIGFVPGAADEVESRVLAGEAGCFDVEEEHLMDVSDAGQIVGIR
jgi:hypothetical protein